MIVKSALKKAVDEVLEEAEVDNRDLAESMLDRLLQEFGDEVYDDDEDEENEE